MFDSSLAVPLHFTVEFVGFLVAAGGAFLVAWRPTLVPGDPGRRRLVALGFAVLAATHVMHGGAFMPTDGDEVLTIVRSMGYALMLVGLVGKAEVTAGVSAPAALRVQDPLPLVPAALALLSAAAAFSGSFRGGPRTYRRLAAGLFLLAVAEVLVSASPSVQFGVGESNQWAFLSHGIKAAGYVAIGSWFWSSIKLSIRSRFVASFVTLLVVVVLSLATVLTAVISDQVENEELKRVDIQLGAALTALRADQAELFDSIERLRTFGPSLSLPLARGTASPEEIALNLEVDAQDSFDADFIVVTSDRTPSLGFAPSRGKGDTAFAVEVLGTEVVQQLDDLAGLGFETDIEKVRGELVILAAAEVPHPDNRQGISVGKVILGKRIGPDQMEVISETFDPAEASVVVNGRTVASTLPPAVAKRDLVPPEVERLLATGRAQSRQSFGNRSYFTAFAPIRRIGDSRQIGILALSTPDSALVADTRESITRVLFLVAMAAAAVAMGLAYYSGRRITRPIQQLTATAQRVREGDLEAQAPVAGDDEVGQLGETFNEMTTSMLRLTEDLRLAAREEEQLRGRIETIIESMADGLVAVDRDANVLAFNRQAQELTGHTPDQALGVPIEEVLQVTNSKGEPVNLPVFELGAGSTAGVFIRAREEDPIPVAVTSAVILDEDDEIAGAVAVLRDMTREREIERMKSEFLSNISHELRTPLTPIKGYAEILSRREVPPDKLKRFTLGILESTSRLERIVELLVDFSAMEAGRLAPKSTPVDIGGMVRALGEQTEAKNSRHEVVLDIKARLPKVVGDERLLKRSLEEVLDNAVKFSPNGGTIRLEVRGVAAGNGQGKRRGVAVSISDEGIGIEPENLERIFSDFQQLDGSETRSYGGLGLGLAFVQRIIEAHEGRVDVDSIPDEGTRFTITLPGASARSAN